MNENKCSRYDVFCQFRSEIRSNPDYVIVGIDIAKDRHHAFFGTTRGETLKKRLIFDNSEEGFGSLKLHIESVMAKYAKSKVVVATEPTGNYHKALCAWLTGQGYWVVQVSGKAVSENRQMLDGRWDKNDMRDSANIADLISQGKCQFFDEPDQQIVALRNLLSLRKRLKQDEHRLRMRIRNTLVCKYFPELDQYMGRCHQENMAIIRWCLDPKEISRMSINDFVKRVTRTKPGQRQMDRLRRIHEAAGKSIGCQVDDSTRFEAKMLVDRLEVLQGQLDETMDRIQDIAKETGYYDRLLTIPGFGPYVSAVVISIIGNPFRFTSHKKLLRIAGLDLSASRSGKTSDMAVPVISKKGNGDLRYGLYQAAQVATSKNNTFVQLFTRCLKGRERERGIKTRMRVKISAKMLVIAWSMMKSGQEFNSALLGV
jgi:transposase